MNVNQALIVLRMNHVPDSDAELREAYKVAAAMWHPDRARLNGVDDATASRNMSQVNQANMLIKGVMLIRQESRVGRYYSDPIWGQHFARDEYGYVTSDSSLSDMVLLLRGLMRGTRVHRGQGARQATPKALTAGKDAERKGRRKPTPRQPISKGRRASDTGGLRDTGSMPGTV